MDPGDEDLWDKLSRWVGEIDYESEEVTLVLIVASFMVVALSSAGAVWFIGHALQEYTASRVKSKLAEYEKKYPLDEGPDSNNNSNNSSSSVNPFAKLAENKNKLNLVCVYGTTETPAPAVGSTMCVDGETGYVMITGGVQPHPAGAAAASLWGDAGGDTGLRQRKQGGSGVGHSMLRPGRGAAAVVGASSSGGSAAELSHMHIYSSSERRWLNYRVQASAAKAKTEEQDTGAPAAASTAIHRSYGCMQGFFNAQCLYFGGTDETGLPRNELFTFDLGSQDQEVRDGCDNYTGRWVQLPVCDAGRGCFMDRSGKWGGRGIRAIDVPDSRSLRRAGWEYVFTPPARYNASMCRYKENCYVVFGGCGTNVKISPAAAAAAAAAGVEGSEEGASSASSLRLYNDVWLLHVDRQDFLYYEALYAHSQPTHPVEWLDQLKAKADPAVSVALQQRTEHPARPHSAGTIGTVAWAYNQCLEQHLANSTSSKRAGLQLSPPPRVDGNSDVAAEAEAGTDGDAGGSVDLDAMEITPMPRQAHCAAIVGDNMFVFGGMTSLALAPRVSDAEAGSSANSSSDAVPVMEGVVAHEAGLVELFNLSSLMWFVCNACGEHPAGPLVGVSAHTLFDTSDERTEGSDDDDENDSSADNDDSVVDSVDSNSNSHDSATKPSKKARGQRVRAYNCSGKIIVLSASTPPSSRDAGGTANLEEESVTMGAIFNTAFVLDVAVRRSNRTSTSNTLSSSSSASGFSPLKLQLTWTKFTYHWLGDWSVLPPSRVFYSSAVDEDEGLLYIFGGYGNRNNAGEDIALLPNLNRGAANAGVLGVHRDTEGNTNSCSSREAVRQSRLNRLNAASAAAGKGSRNVVQVGVNVYSSTNATRQEEDGDAEVQHKLREVETLPDMLVVDISSLLEQAQSRAETSSMRSLRAATSSYDSDGELRDDTDSDSGGRSRRHADTGVRSGVRGRITGARKNYRYNDGGDDDEDMGPKISSAERERQQALREVTRFDEDEEPVSAGAATPAGGGVGSASGFGRGRLVRMVRDRDGQLTEEYFLPKEEQDSDQDQDQGTFQDQGKDDEREREQARGGTAGGGSRARGATSRRSLAGTHGVKAKGPPPHR